MRNRIADYYPRYRQRALALIALGHAAAIGIAMGAYYVVIAWWHHDQVLALIIAMGTFFVISLLLQLLLFKLISEPVKVVSFAVNHVSRQLTDLPPPDINLPRFEKDGLKPLVQTIYDLALNSPELPDAVPTATNAEARNHPATTTPSVILDSLPGGLIGLNADRRIALHNRQAPVRTKPGSDQEILQLLFDDGDDLWRWLDEVEGAKVRDQKVWTRIPDRLPGEEGRRLFDVIASYEKGSSSGYDTVILTVDRTEAYATAEEDMDFIALAAHELRGPTTVIRGYLDVLVDELNPQLSPDQKELFERINVSANRLGNYINNILNVSRYDRRHLKLHLHEERLGDVINSLRDDLDMRARTQNRILTYNLPDDLPTIAADRNSLGEVISNLVDNAIKYSREGGQVIVSASVKGDFVECTVQDFGIGIPGNVAGNLFGKFYRSHVSRSSVAGTGLGLYISKAIIESHGGQMWVNSTEGQGSTFGFSVPVYATVADKLQASNNENADIIESAHGWIKNHAMVRK